VDALRLTPQRSGKSMTRNIAGKISGPIVELGGGPLAFAAGFNLGREELTDRPDANQQAGNVFGSIPQAAVDGSRNSRAVFGELSIPVFKGFEAQVALRYDQYTDLEAVINGTRQNFQDSSKTSPKFALKYQPANYFMARASYAESFLAPSLKQLFGGQDQGAESTSDPDVCAFFGVLPADCTNFPYKEQSGSNPNLKPETGKTTNIGFVFEPTQEVGVSVDFFEIRKRDEIDTPTVEDALADGSFAFVNGEWVVFVNNQNFAQTRIRGVDVDLRVRLGQTPLGRLSLRNSTTYYDTIAQRQAAELPWEELAGTFLSPRVRNTLAASLEEGPWTHTLAVRYTGHMKDTDQELGTVANANARRIESYEEVDIGTQYAGIKNLKLGFLVKNVFDRQVPYSNMGASNQYGSLGFPYIYSPRGRFFSLVANYKFK
jgi:iron complex outermembrane receptor protein